MGSQRDAASVIFNLPGYRLFAFDQAGHHGQMRIANKTEAKCLSGALEQLADRTF